MLVKKGRDNMNLESDEMLINYINEKIIANSFQSQKYTTFNNTKLHHRNIFKKIIKYVDDFLSQDTYHRMITIPGTWCR